MGSRWLRSSSEGHLWFRRQPRRGQGPLYQQLQAGRMRPWLRLEGNCNQDAAECPSHGDRVIGDLSHVGAHRKSQGKVGSLLGAFPPRVLSSCARSEDLKSLSGFLRGQDAFLAGLSGFLGVLPPCLRDRSPDEGAPPSLSHRAMPLLGLPLGRLGRVFVVMGM